ncbi:unnamed protein product [Strongylus vulgaris]|uniref:Uncharacterized protein n=1 Tax=Strongylus vulgaris TaxID=40348 RepID=A0A3P7KYJ7_STRVU|nr:unnamed protein product [Strongylus vulgaris]
MRGGFSAIAFNINGVKKLPYEFAYCDNKDLIPNSANTTEEAHDNFQVYLSRAAKEAAVSEGITRSTNDTSVNLSYSPIKCCDGQKQLCHGTNEIVQVYDPKERLFLSVTLNGVFGTITMNVVGGDVNDDKWDGMLKKTEENLKSSKYGFVLDTVVLTRNKTLESN